MRIGWIAAGLTVALCGGALARPGKVVKIERRPAVRQRAIAICSAMLGGPERFTCLTGDVSVSEPLHLISKQGDYERLEILRRLPSPLDSCNLGNPFDVTIRAASRRASSRHRDTFALAGVEVFAGTSRLLPTDNIAPPDRGVEVGIAIDLIGDGRPELLATSRPCPETQRAEGRLAGKTVHQSICVAVWERPPRTSRWRKNSEAVLHFCQ